MKEVASRSKRKRAARARSSWESIRASDAARSAERGDEVGRNQTWACPSGNSALIAAEGLLRGAGGGRSANRGPWKFVSAWCSGVPERTGVYLTAMRRLYPFLCLLGLLVA